MFKTLLCLVSFCIFSATAAPQKIESDFPKIPREFRSAWVATVANIDWPSKKTLTTDQQKAELIKILDVSAGMNLNALVLQIRPMCDALYPSDLEPWSEFLTGKMGQAPVPYYDPLEFVIEESHKRGIELHVWFNPYRARHTSSSKEIAANHISKLKPEIVRQYGEYLWLDPAEEETKRHTLAVILDVVKRYKVDGIHIDDYFYPYKSYAKGADFPDDAPWQTYTNGGGKLSRDDWRRGHVNDFVERMYREVKKENPLVKVGISPFGIWRPGVPEGTFTAFDQYSELYADAKLWLNKGWLDYWTPQLYWPLSAEQQSYTTLMKWWVDENHQKRHFWPGNFTSKVGNSSGWEPDEVINQIKATRGEPGASGNVHFSMVAFSQNRQGLTDKLRDGLYAQPALVPASPWLSKETPAEPIITMAKKMTAISGSEKPKAILTINFTSPAKDKIRLWVVYQKKDSGKWDYKFVPAAGKNAGSFEVPEDVVEVAVSAVDLNGTEGPRKTQGL